MKFLSRLFTHWFLVALITCAVKTRAADDCPDNKSPNVIYYNTGKTTDGSPFQKNLNDVYQVLLDHAPLAGSSDFNHGSGSDKVYGAAVCVKGNDCKGCLQLAKSNFDKAAPLAVGGTLCLKTSSNDVCYLRYEAYSFRFNCVQSLA